MKGKSFRILLASVVRNAVHSQYPRDISLNAWFSLSPLELDFLLDSSDTLFGTKNRIFGKTGCLVFKPHYCVRSMGFGSRGSSESDTSPKCIDRGL